MDDLEGLLAELRSTHGAVDYVETEDGVVVVGRPDAATHDQLIDQLSNEKFSRAIALRTFALRCVVHPEPQTAKTILTKFPFAADELATKAQELGKGRVRQLGNG